MNTGASVSVILKEFVKGAKLSTGVVKTTHQTKLPYAKLMNFEEGISGPFVVSGQIFEAIFTFPRHCLALFGGDECLETFQVNQD